MSDGRSAANPQTRPTALDLFSGAGGFSLGFARAGFRILGGVELDPKAHATHVLNFPPEIALESPADIRTLDPKETVRGIQDGQPIYPDAIIGGPPCQPFSRVGLAKLREVRGSPTAHLDDDRVSLWAEYLRFVKVLRPRVFVIENVHHLGNFGGRNLAEVIASSAEDLGFNVRYTVLNAVWYGVPQMRERIFIIGTDARLDLTPTFPKRRFRADVPRGYATSRSDSLQRPPVLRPCPHFVRPPRELPNALPAVTAREAIGDLPPITEHLTSAASRKPASIEVEVPYRQGRPSEYSSDLRSWPGFEGNGGISAHRVRHTPRDYETFRRMPPGGQYPEAFRVANERYREARELLVEKGQSPGRDLKSSIVPPYDHTKFPNKWRKLRGEEPAHTLPAHLGKDSYSHIHFDSDQARMISVREAARLHSFPDGFRFAGPLSSAFRQIGEAVPPLLAFAVARHLRTRISSVDGWRDLSNVRPVLRRPESLLEWVEA